MWHDGVLDWTSGGRAGVQGALCTCPGTQGVFTHLSRSQCSRLLEWDCGVVLWTECVPLPQIHAKALTSNVTVFGDRVYQEVIKVK